MSLNTTAVGEVGLSSSISRYRLSERGWTLLRGCSGSIHVYGPVSPFKRDCRSHDEIVQIARDGAPQNHQFILKPVSGEGRVRHILYHGGAGGFNPTIGYLEAQRNER